MKKGIIFLFLFIFVFQLCAFSQETMTEQEIKEKIEKIEREIERLNRKLDATKVQERKERLKKLIAGHRANLNKMQGLLAGEKEKEVKKEEPKYKMEAVQIKVVKLPPKKYFLINAGVEGGALMIQGNYLHPFSHKFRLGGNVGYALGQDNQFNILKASVQAQQDYDNYFIGAEAGYVKYSDDVTDVPGISGIITSEDKFGFGIYIGTEYKPFTAQIGYNTALGITADIGYKFEFE